MSSHRLSIRISPDLEHRIRQRARSAGRRPSAVVRDVLEQHFADHEPAPSCYELARRAGVIGCAADAPSDLSTNPQYFEGFGGR
jgi:predicted DNA-binding protein